MRRSEAQNLADRVRRYVEKMPAAISGSGGHDATFAVARTLIHGFALPEAVAWPILCEYNARCQPPWSERELRHKLADAGKLTKPSKPRGHLLGSEDSPKTFFPAPPKPEVMPWPVKIKPLPSKGPQPGSAPSPKPEPPDDYPRRKEETERLLRESRPRTLAKDWPASDSEISVATVADDDPEARRIAGELVKFHRDGAIKGPDDPRGRILRTFDSHLRGNIPSGGNGRCHTRWSARILTGNAQPRTREEHRAFLEAAFEPGELFDFTNPDDVAQVQAALSASEEQSGQ